MKRPQIEFGYDSYGAFGGVRVDRCGAGVDLAVSCLGSTNKVHLTRDETERLRGLLGEAMTAENMSACSGDGGE